jgi:hypothetical protein
VVGPCGGQAVHLGINTTEVEREFKLTILVTAAEERKHEMKITGEVETS